MILSEEEVARAVLRKQCGIPIDETADTTIICPEEAVGEIEIPLEDGMVVPMPICQGHLDWLQENYSKKLDSA